MIARPTTQALLVDCADALREEVLPFVSDETAQVAVVMLETVLRNAAVRAAHEIAWMAEETAAALDFARRVTGASEAAHTPAPGLHLDDVVGRYEDASRKLAEALDEAVASRRGELAEAGRALLDARLAREREVMASYAVVGR